MDKPDKGRREIVKKAVYVAPVLTSFTLGALAQSCNKGKGHGKGKGCSPPGPP